MALEFDKSEVGVANLALHYISQVKGSTINDTGPAMRTMKFMFPQARDMLLQQYVWSCARSLKQLTSVTNDLAGRWAYKYTYPGDCLKILRVVQDDGFKRYDSNTQRYPHEYINAAIYTDVNDAYLDYIKEYPDVGVWPNYFIEAVAAALAARCTMNITKRPQLADKMKEDALRIIATSLAIDGNQSSNSYDEYEDEFTQARK